MKVVTKKNGFTLVELLVVLSIFGLMSLLIVPSMVRFYINASDPVRLTSRELYQIYMSARLYAMTYRVRTAVVYGEKRFIVGETNVIDPQGQPTLGTTTVHAIVSATVMYEISRRNNPEYEAIRDRLGIPSSWDSFYVPIGDWKSALPEHNQFRPGVALCDMELREVPVDLVDEQGNRMVYIKVPILKSMRSYENQESGKLPPPDFRSLHNLGLSLVRVPFLDLEGTILAFIAHSEENEESQVTWFAHVFSPSGQLIVTSGDTQRERYNLPLLYITNPEVADGGGIVPVSLWKDYRKVIITLYRATGRVKINI